MLGDAKLTPGSDYTVVYPDRSSDAGTYRVDVVGVGGFVGQASAEFTIAPKKATPKLALFSKSCTYTGKARRPSLKVSVGSKKLLQSEYVAKYTRNVSVGVAKVSVSLTGNYTGSRSATFKIVPRRPVIEKVSPGNRSFTVKWDKSASQSSGYKLRYSTASDFANAKTVNVSGASATKRTIRKLKPATTYYVRVQRYKRSGATTCLSDWSLTSVVRTL